MSQARTLYVGMDVPKASMAVASVAHAQGAAVLALGPLGTRQCASDTRIRQLRSPSQQRVFVDAAGPCGSWLSRSLRQPGDVCGVVAPSLLPKKAGARGTTARREARQLARRMRSGARTPVDTPTVDDAAIRALRRAREETLRELQAAQWRRTAFVRRPELRSPGRAHGSPAPLRWRSEVVCPPPAQPLVLQAYVQTVPAQTERLGRLARDLPEQGHTWRFAPGGEARQALRGGPGPVAVPPVAALGALTRCEPPRQRMPSLGRTPSASTRGGRRQQGRRTQTGPTHARRALVAGAGASRSAAPGRRPLPLRLEQLPTGSQARRWPAQGRRGTRERQRLATGHHAQQGVVAMTRAGRACLWAMAQQGPVPPQAERGRWRDSSLRGCPRLSAEAQPRCGGTLGGVLRPLGTLGPRMRQAPDGCQEGGSPPTDSSVINRRLCLAPALPIDQGETP
jgi:transposase